MLWEKSDNKTADNFKAQIKYAPLYLDRREAYTYFAKHHMPELMLGLKDKYAGLRSYTLDLIGEDSALVSDPSTLETIENLTKTETDKKTKSKAIEILAATGDAKYKPLFEQNVNDSSYSVAGAALEGLNTLDPTNAYALAKKFSQDAKGKLGEVVAGVVMLHGTEEDFDFVLKQYEETPPGQGKFEATAAFCQYLATLTDPAKIKRGVDAIVTFKNMIPETYRTFTDQIIKNALEKVAAAKGGEVKTYIENEVK
jgi:aminopeptidase N